MKYLIPFVFLFLLAISCSETSQEGITIKGVLKNPAGGYVYVQKLQEGGFATVDSTGIEEGGKYKLNLDVSSDGFYRLNFSNRQFVNLILDGEEDEVIVNADGGNPKGEATVTGSRHTELIREIDSIARLKQSDIELLNNEAVAAQRSNRDEVINDIREQYFYLVEKYDNILKDKIADAAPSLAGIYGLNYLKVEDDIDFADSIASIYNEKLPDHFLVKDLNQEVQGYKKLAVGSPAPPIELPTPDGDLLALQSLRGDYVLIDFWAAWCRPCRMENPNVVRLYNKYQNENFEILGVSLDRKKEDWVRAIEKDNLTWKHVSDLQYFNSAAAREYNINAIPATYLIDPEGKIIAKGLRGASLEKKLQELFGS